MKRLNDFKSFFLTIEQMKYISGGNKSVTLSCVNADGGTTSLYVPHPAGNSQIAAAVDNFNSTSGLSPIVGCDVAS